MTYLEYVFLGMYLISLMISEVERRVVQAAANVNLVQPPTGVPTLLTENIFGYQQPHPVTFVIRMIAR